MKELISPTTLPQVDKQEIVQNHEITKLASVRRRRGMKLFVLRNGEVSEARFDSASAVIGTDGKKRSCSNITIEKGDFYVQALNKKNAIKKLKNLGKTTANT